MIYEHCDEREPLYFTSQPTRTSIPAGGNIQTGNIRLETTTVYKLNGCSLNEVRSLKSVALAFHHYNSPLAKYVSVHRLYAKLNICLGCRG